MNRKNIQQNNERTNRMEIERASERKDETRICAMDKMKQFNFDASADRQYVAGSIGFIFCPYYMVRSVIGNDVKTKSHSLTVTHSDIDEERERERESDEHTETVLAFVRCNNRLFTLYHTHI